MAKRDVVLLLDEWAGWALRTPAWEGACPLGRAMESTRSGTPGSRVPGGVELPRSVQLVNLALANGESNGYRQQMRVIRAVYRARALNRRGEFPMADLARQLGMPLPTVKHYRAIGEAYIGGVVFADGRIAA